MDATTKNLLATIVEQNALLIAALNGGAPAKAPKAAKAKKAAKKAQPASLVAAKSHCFEARMARRASTKLGGLTKAERSALYAEHPELSAMTATARRTAWNRIVAAHKAA